MEQKEFTDQTAENPEVQARPAPITVICVLGFIGAVLTIPMVFSQAARHVADWYPSYLGLSAATGLACMVGLWNMKKWGAYIYTAFVVLNQIILISLGMWNFLALAIPAIVAGIALAYADKMD